MGERETKRGREIITRDWKNYIQGNFIICTRNKILDRQNEEGSDEWNM
jgi:hypothetical protein